MSMMSSAGFKLSASVTGFSTANSPRQSRLSEQRMLDR
jgi:hypothetical protein